MRLLRGLQWLRAARRFQAGGSSLMVNGVERTYQVFVPAKVNEPAALVLVLHGGGGRASGMRLMSGFDAVADDEGFIVAYPDGLERSWNDGRGSQHVARSGADDVGFIAALIDQLVTKYSIDRQRVYVAGMSNGGMMTYRLACDLSDKIAGFAAVTANITADFARTCKPPRPVRMLMMNGTDDPIMPYQGGTVGVFGRDMGQVLSTEETVGFWTTANGCQQALPEQLLPDLSPMDGTRVYRTIYGGCKAGGAVVFYRIQGGGHTWPKQEGGQYLPERRIGRVSRDIEAAEVIWAFFHGATNTFSKG